MTPLFLLFAAIGLVLGSFGNVLICRIRSNERIFGRSRCTTCHRTLHATELFPIVSYCFLGGRCSGCKKPISAQYPLVEFGSMCAFVLGLYLHMNDPLIGFFTASALYFLFLACAYDALYQQIPDVFTLLVGLMGIVLVLLDGDALSSTLGVGVALVWFGGQWAVSRGTSVGTGDIFLAAALGFWLGWLHLIMMIVGSYMIGAVIIVALIACGRISLKNTKRIAFAPFLGASTVMVLLGVGDLYLSLIS